MAKRRRVALHEPATDQLSTSPKVQDDFPRSRRDKGVRMELELKECGSFMSDHQEGVSPESTALCLELLTIPRKIRPDSQFAHRFTGLCRYIKGKNKATVVRYLTRALVPSGVMRAIYGHEDLEFLSETIDARWINAMQCCQRRPHPDYALGIGRDAFTLEQLERLQLFLGTFEDESPFAATYDTLFPFLTAEVRCGEGSLDEADRQNALSQTVGLRGLVRLFRQVDRAHEVHREVLGFSISHNDEVVRIYGHYPFIDGDETTYHRHAIANFAFVPTLESDHRLKTPRFVSNLHDIWAPKHFQRICSAIDAL